VEKVYTHIWMAYHLFHNFHFCQCHLVSQVAFRAELAFWMEVQPDLVEVCTFLSASSVSTDSLLCHLGMEGSQPYDFYKPLPGVFLLQPSSFFTQETQLLASSLLGLPREDS